MVDQIMLDLPFSKDGFIYLKFDTKRHATKILIIARMVENKSNNKIRFHRVTKDSIVFKIRK